MYFIGSPCELQIFYHGISVEDCQNEMSKHREVYDRLSEMFPDFGIYPILGRIPPLLSEVKVGDEC